MSVMDSTLLMPNPRAGGIGPIAQMADTWGGVTEMDLEPVSGE